MTVEPLRVAFRREVRGPAPLAVAAELAMEQGWSRVRMGGVAEGGRRLPPDAVQGVRRQGRGSARRWCRAETERFLVGVSGHPGRRAGRPRGTPSARPWRFTLDEAGRSPLLHAVLTSTRDDTAGLLPLLTTRSGSPARQRPGSVVETWLGCPAARGRARGRVRGPPTRWCGSW